MFNLLGFKSFGRKYLGFKNFWESIVNGLVLVKGFRVEVIKALGLHGLGFAVVELKV